MQLAPKTTLALTLALSTSVLISPIAIAKDQTNKYPSIQIDKSGYPSKKTVAHMFDEMAFHGATQAFLWADAILVNDAWRQANLKVAGPLDFVTYTTVEEKYNIITSNMNTPYMTAFPNLKETGPLIIEVPPGKTGGILNDIESRHIGDTGLAGPDKGKGGKYLVLHESWDEPKDHGADFVLRSKTFLFWMGTRILNPDPDALKRLQHGHKIYPLGAEPKTKIVSIGNTEYEGWPPSGMAYWEAINNIIQIEQFPESAGYMLEFLRRVGIEKGKKFDPTPRQRRILERAAAYGKTMAESLSNGRINMQKPFYGNGSNWTVPLGSLSNSQHLSKTGAIELDALVSYTWEAFSMSDGMMKNLVGVGSKYLAAYSDSNGAWLDGSNTYQLTIPADPPAEQFWSFIVYSQASRAFLQNKDRKPGVSSRDDLVKNEDGSITVTIGPEKPEGVAPSNFIYSNPNEGWFTYFRFYAPKKPFFDKSWKLPDIKRIAPLEKLTDANFAKAMTDIYFKQVVDRGGVNKFSNARHVSGVESQNIIRENRDTLYSWGVFDVTKGLDITLPPSNGLYMSALVIDNDDFIVPSEDSAKTGDVGTYLADFKNPRTIRISRKAAGTDFVYVVLRTQTDATKEGDKIANALQDAVRTSQGSQARWASRAWDIKAVRAKEKTYIPKLAEIVAQGTSEGYNVRGKTKQDILNFYAAIGWGGQLERYATYGTTPTFTDFGKACATTTIKKPNVDYPKAGFWSYQVYGPKGWIRSDRSTLNNKNTKPNADGTITLYFGSKEACGTDQNRADKEDDGFSITTRFYNPVGKIAPALRNPPLTKVK